ncbi:MAG: hypothetical protein ACFFG0_10375 [Candidatus Thorarchaeota archaeon]
MTTKKKTTKKAVKIPYWKTPAGKAANLAYRKRHNEAVSILKSRHEDEFKKIMTELKA